MFEIIPELFRSVEWVWAVWTAGLVAIVLLTRGCVRAIRRHSQQRRALRSLHGCDAGTAYSLSYMLTIPMLALIICLTIDMTLILVAKIGTVYSAYAAARSSVVWFPSGVSRGDAQNKMDLAARQAMTPFASGSTRHRPLSMPAASGLTYLAAHKAFADKPADLEYLGWKYQYAGWATKVTTDAGPNYRKDVTVTLEYQAPFHMPAIGRIFGKLTPYGFYTTTITTVVKLENQAPRTDVPNPASRPLGISYVPALK
ncbi:MAG: hypothetical protein QM775_15960 [Pirellulales bacterium]